ncbi:MAG: DoxX family protein [Polyangiaceae bacterium]
MKTSIALDGLPTESPVQAHKLARWSGRVVSALPALMMLVSGAMKLSHAPPMVEMWTSKFGWSEAALTPIAILEVIVALVYLIPSTAVLGAILVTGYLGAAYATHLRIGEGNAVIPIVLGVFAWAGLYLRDPRVRALLPLRKH